MDTAGATSTWDCIIGDGVLHSTLPLVLDAGNDCTGSIDGLTGVCSIGIFDWELFSTVLSWLSNSALGCFTTGSAVSGSG